MDNLAKVVIRGWKVLGAAFVAGYVLGTRGRTGRVPFDPSAFAAGYTLGRMATKLDPSRPVVSQVSTIIHKVPRVPIILDGTHTNPETVKQFDGQPLYFVLDKRALSEKVLPVFSTAEQAQEYRNQIVARQEQTPAREAVDVAPQAAPPGVQFSGYVTLYEHINYGGSAWTFWANWGDIPDFTHVFCFLWFCSNINDRASSVDTNIKILSNTDTRIPWTVLHEHINFQGSQLLIPNDIGLVDNLDAYGWNDRASSMSYTL